jgi:hypothetical protein
MSLPIMVFPMSSKNEDFPTPVSPTSRIVYGVFALFFDVLMIPFLRDSTSLENKVRADASKLSLNLLDGRDVTPIGRINIVDRFSGWDFIAGRAISDSNYP